MLPRMSEEETALFLSFVRNSRDYVEFGTGGSTVLASKYVKRSIRSVDSSQEWLKRVGSACAECQTQPELMLVDIGPTGDWGFPTDGATKSRWPDYHSAIWRYEQSADADLYLVDGRFRIACFAQTVLHCKPTAIIGFHDFSSRRPYHCVRKIAQEIATAGDLSFFLPLPRRDAAEAILRSHYTEPS
ncbi:hypothetical protein ACVIWV_010092 [Bradyrhizobium diazoefficiens]|jgi:hypothetical protein|nr:MULTISPECIES: hypothetical protein [Bradyrhizobium]MCD9825108.1 hypothetical protein [Bradyrhizobium japonicum]MCD9897974.1 hypothetical protein [Bradyrhizobium japonicum]MCP1768745.1 hypothetical protein [Bradyrhizobium japonicum]MCP1795111.1 hypothetical protein [Bradyrhizobium japonicum]MCP1811555.1 hypothetical protein [Bradyrhizobium japonicum]